MKIENKKLIELSSIPKAKIYLNTKWFLKHSMGKNMNIADIMIRILAIENYYGKNDFGFKLYNKMQKIRVSANPLIPQYRADNEERFRQIIKSFEKNNFIEDYPIIINEDFKLFDGTHRLACSIFFNIVQIPVKFEERTIERHPDYSLKWFEKVGLEDYIPIIEEKYQEIIRGEYEQRYRRENKKNI